MKDITPEQNLWVNVVLQAAKDAEKHYQGNNVSGAAGVFSWIKSSNGKAVCNYANLDYDMILNGIAKLYKSQLQKDMKVLRRKAKKGNWHKNKLHAAEKLIYQDIVKAQKCIIEN